MGGYGYRSRYRGMYKVKNPEKYQGDPEGVVYRSKLEYDWFTVFDNASAVTKWASEELHIPYINKLDGKPHRYFVDLAVEFNNGKKYLIEIKPSSELVPPKRNDTKKAMRFVENDCKWTYARKFAEDNGMQFMVLTERELLDFKK